MNKKKRKLRGKKRRIDRFLYVVNCEKCFVVELTLSKERVDTFDKSKQP